MIYVDGLGCVFMVLLIGFLFSLDFSSTSGDSSTTKNSIRKIETKP